MTLDSGPFSATVLEEPSRTHPPPLNQPLLKSRHNPDQANLAVSKKKNPDSKQQSPAVSEFCCQTRHHVSLQLSGLDLASGFILASLGNVWGLTVQIPESKLQRPSNDSHHPKWVSLLELCSGKLPCPSFESLPWPVFVETAVEVQIQTAGTGCNLKRARAIPGKRARLRCLY